MTDLFDLNLISNQATSKSRRTYSQRNVSSLQLELTKNRKMINMKTAKTTILNRTLSFKPMSEASSSLANVENTPMKKSSSKFETPTTKQEVIEETPVKDDDVETENMPSDKMMRDIQRLSVRLRSTIPCAIDILVANRIQILLFILVFDIPVTISHTMKPATLHLSQVANRVSRCNYVLRHFVREAQKYSPKLTEIQVANEPALLSQSYEKGRRRLFIDSPQQHDNNSISENQPPTTPRKASGVIKQLFASPSASFKRTTSSSSNTNIIVHDKRQKLF
ncbi:unnamed protein product [Adineta ricciae]|uniref:Uncharacterized protein n=1 Tax=Adineta ricciae TaxID=249248 RepID=A0A813UP13_ADIRI|nr:unnamed protein product [Adineta ricciae]